jgi:hypothetical protein
VLLSIKSYLVPHLVVSAGSGYWEKTYLKSLEPHPIFGYGLPKDAPRRHDFYSRYYLSLQRPIPIGTYGFLEPTVTLDYAKNNSTQPGDEQFDFSSTTISLAITYRN